MPSGMVFPFDFGFIPDTKGEDGDPLDILIISELKSFPGCCMECRVVGRITVDQTEYGNAVRNDRFIAIPAVSHLFAEVNSIDELPANIIKQIEFFL